MEWYPGSIEAAVGAVRERDTLLIVLVRGKMGGGEMGVREGRWGSER